MLFLLCTTEAPYILLVVAGFTILPLNHFCLDVGVLPDHALVCQLLNHHHSPALAVPHPITRQRKLFCLLVHHGIPIRIKVDILIISHGMHLVVPTHLSLFWVVFHSSGTFSPKEFKQESQNRIPHSPHCQTIPSLTFDL